MLAASQLPAVEVAQAVVDKHIAMKTVGAESAIVVFVCVFRATLLRYRAANSQLRMVCMKCESSRLETYGLQHTHHSVGKQKHGVSRFPRSRPSLSESGAFTMFERPKAGGLVELISARFG